MPGGPALAALFLPSRACWASRLFSFSSFAFSRLLFFFGCEFGLPAPPSSSPSSILTPLRATTGTQSAVHTLSSDGGQQRPPTHSLRSSCAPDQARTLAELTSQGPPWQLKAVQTGLHGTPGSQGSCMHQIKHQGDCPPIRAPTWGDYSRDRRAAKCPLCKDSSPDRARAAK